MKTIGIIGGLSYESTIPYYQIINDQINLALGGLHSARIILYSLDFSEVEALQSAGRWAEAGEILAKAARKLEAAGADCIVIATNTLHKVADQIQSAVQIPLVHIGDALCAACKQRKITTAALLGTRYTMEQDFLKSRLQKQGIAVLIPKEEDREFIHQVIFQELCHGLYTPESAGKFSQIIASLKEKGAQAVILGCTEIGLLVKEETSSLPILDTTFLHAAAAVKFALQDETFPA